MDVIVRGQIRVIETGALELAVSRYYKGGSGPARLRAEVRGLGQGERMDWSGLPRVGDELIIGFVKSGESLVNDACHLFVQLGPGQEPEQQVRDLIGPGQAPDPGVAWKTLLWPFGVALLSLGLAFWVIRRWRRRSA